MVWLFFWFDSVLFDLIWACFGLVGFVGLVWLFCFVDLVCLAGLSCSGLVWFLLEFLFGCALICLRGFHGAFALLSFLC